MQTKQIFILLVCLVLVGLLGVRACKEFRTYNSSLSSPGMMEEPAAQTEEPAMETGEPAMATGAPVATNSPAETTPAATPAP